MKTQSHMLLNAALLLALALLARPAAAANLSYAGTLQDLGPGWRTATRTKQPLDINGDNVLGTDGYYVVNRPPLRPAYVSTATNLTTTYPGNAIRH